MKHVIAPNNEFQRFALPGEVVEFSASCKTTAKRLTPEQAAEYGVSKLRLTTPPAAAEFTEIRRETDPVLIDGEWVQQWVVESIVPDDPDELHSFIKGVRAELKLRVNAIRDQHHAAGYSHDFGAEYGVQTLQSRDDRDRTNWLVLDSNAGKLVAAGLGDTLMEMRPESNISMMIPASDVVVILSAMASWGGSVLRRSWELKDQIDAAETVEQLTAIDTNEGWPE